LAVAAKAAFVGVLTPAWACMCCSTYRSWWPFLIVRQEATNYA